MSTTYERSEALAALKSAVCGDSDIEFALVFGTQVTDTARPSSDLDIAVKFDDDLSSSERFRKRGFLAGELK
jgi:predicted nucleotidyltransferase